MVACDNCLHKCSLKGSRVENNQRREFVWSRLRGRWCRKSEDHLLLLTLPLLLLHLHLHLLLLQWCTPVLTLPLLLLKLQCTVHCYCTVAQQSSLLHFASICLLLSTASISQRVAYAHFASRTSEHRFTSTEHLLHYNFKESVPAMPKNAKECSANVKSRPVENPQREVYCQMLSDVARRADHYHCNLQESTSLSLHCIALHYLRIARRADHYHCKQNNVCVRDHPHREGLTEPPWNESDALGQKFC